MNTPPIHAPEITRRTSGLSDTHKDLIRLLAQIAIEDFLRETEPGEVMQMIDEDQA